MGGDNALTSLLIAFVIAAILGVGAYAGVSYVLSTDVQHKQEEEAAQWEQAISEDYEVYIDGLCIEPDNVDYLQYKVSFNHDKKKVYLTRKN